MNVVRAFGGVMETALAGWCFVAGVASPWWALWPLLVVSGLLLADVIVALLRFGQDRSQRDPWGGR